MDAKRWQQWYVVAVAMALVTLVTAPLFLWSTSRMLRADPGDYVPMGLGVAAANAVLWGALAVWFRRRRDASGGPPSAASPPMP
jgi:uncharacterized membrane protein YhaH (DUF805 family)